MDSVQIEVPVEVVIPKDSISLRYINDTLRHTIIREQGRAKIFIHRDSIFTIVKVICKDSIVYVKKIIKVPVTQTFNNEKVPIWVWFAGAATIFILTFALIKK